MQIKEEEKFIVVEGEEVAALVLPCMTVSKVVCEGKRKRTRGRGRRGMCEERMVVAV